MAVKRGRKLLWAFTLLFVASAAVFLTAFTFTPTLVSAADTAKNCGKQDPATGIRQCNETVLKNHPSPVIPETKTCMKACEDATGIPASIVSSTTDAGGIYCVDAQETFSCEGVSFKVLSLDERIKAVAAKDAAIKEKQAAEEEKCGFLGVECWVRKLITAVGNIGATILNSVVQLFAIILEALAGLLQKAMTGIIKSFMAMPVSPSNGGAPEFVKQAWDKVRELTNNFFILILAFIGLATILRIEAYQLKKTLPVLLLVALLVNFSGVLVGLVADVGNIITSYFLDQADNAPWDNIKVPSFNVKEGAANLGINIVRIIYSAISSLIFLGVMIAFGLRTIVLWTLAIVSPLAFAAYILPATRGLATGWWKQLIQWALFGIPLSFFLYLASLTLNPGYVPGGGLTVGAVSNFFAPFTTLFLLFTGITMSMAMAPAAAQAAGKFGAALGAKAALATGSWAMRNRYLGAGAQRFAENLSRRGKGQEVKDEDKTLLERMPGVSGLLNTIAKPSTRENYERQLQNFMSNKGRVDELLGKKGPLTEEEGDELDRLQDKVEGVNPEELRKKIDETPRTQGLGMWTRAARFGARTVGGGLEIGAKELTMRIGDKDTREFQQGMKDVGDKDSFMVFNMVKEELLKGPLANRNRILGLLNGVRNRGDGDDIEAALEQGILKKELIGQVIKTGLRVGPPGFRPLLKTFLGDIMVSPQEYGFAATRDKATGKWEGKDAGLLTKDLGIERILSKFNAQDFQGDTLAPQNFNMDTEAGRLFMQLMIKERGADFMGQIARRPRKAESIAAMQYIFKDGKYAETGLGENWLLDNNAEDVLRYLDSPGARSLGLGRNITRDEIEAKIAQRKAGQTLPQLLEQVVRLEQQRDETTSVRRRTVFQRQIDEINTTVNDMRKTPEELEKEAKIQQDEITRVDKIIKEGKLEIADARSRVTAKTRYDQIQQQLSKGITLPTTPQEQSYTTLLEQRTRLQTQLQEQQRQMQDELARIAPRRQQLLQEIERVRQEILAPGLTSEYVSNLQQQIPLAQQDLANIEATIERARGRFENEIQQTAQQLEQTEQQVGSMEIELGRVPEPLAPMPEIQPNMPDPLKRLINQGNTEINTITEWTKELQSNLAGMRESREDLTEITQTMAKLNEELRELNAQNQATLQPELQARLPELQGEIQRLRGRETVLSQQITTYQGEAAKARQGILTSKQKVDGPDGIRERVGAQIEPLQRKYERTQRSQQREQRLKQRQKRRGRR